MSEFSESCAQGVQPAPPPFRDDAPETCGEGPKASASADAAGRKLGIWCEGQTEARYFQEVCSALGLVDRVVIHASSGGDPRSRLEDVAKTLWWDRMTDRERFSEAWLVYDRDAHAGFHQAFEQAALFPEIHLAITNPCFEFWVLLHARSFSGALPLVRTIVLGRESREEQVTSSIRRRIEIVTEEACASPEDALRYATRFFPAYRKNMTGILDMIGRETAFACGRAESLASPQEGQGSGIPALLERLFGLAGLSREEGFARLAGRSPEEPAAAPSEAEGAAADSGDGALREGPLAEWGRTASRIIAAHDEFNLQFALPAARRLVLAVGILGDLLREGIARSDPQALGQWRERNAVLKFLQEKIRSNPLEATADDYSCAMQGVLDFCREMGGDGPVLPGRGRLLEILQAVEVAGTWLARFSEEAAHELESRGLATEEAGQDAGDGAASCIAIPHYWDRSWIENGQFMEIPPDVLKLSVDVRGRLGSFSMRTALAGTLGVLEKCSALLERTTALAKTGLPCFSNGFPEPPPAVLEALAAIDRDATRRTHAVFMTNVENVGKNCQRLEGRFPGQPAGLTPRLVLQQRCALAIVVRWLERHAEEQRRDEAEVPY